MRSKIACKILTGVALAFLLTTCYEPKEGCLDVNATNFDVEADDPCGDCCEYPVIKVDFQHKFILPDTTVNLEYDNVVYKDGAGNEFGISRIRFYLANLHFLRPNGEEVISTDTIGIKVPQPEGDTIVEVIEDNFALVDPGNFRQKEMGTIRSEGNFSEIVFTLGLSGAANQADPGTLPEDHPLAAEDMYWNPTAGHIYNKIELFRVEGESDTARTVLDIGTPGNLRSLRLPAGFILDPGFNPRVLLQVDYQRWFENLNIAQDSENEMIEKIVDNLTESFELLEVTVDTQ